MKDYYVGLDIGTDSVGWAVTDEKYNVLKSKGNAMWGIRLLDESKTAEERRVFRSSRRRTQRDKFRLQCLEMLFSEEISAKDFEFFQRIKDSNLYQEDKSVNGKFSLFNDKDYTDIDYHKEYPTIYHLRKELLETPNPHDIRLVYLAVAHIVKNRGHFLFDSDTLGDNSSPEFKQVWTELSAFLLNNLEVQLDCADIDKVQNILKDTNLSITKKKEALVKEFNITKKDEPQYSIISLLAGATVNSATIFNDELLKDSEASKITFSSNYDDKVAVYESVFGDKFELIERLKAVYDWAVLADILNDRKYLSYAKCDIFDKHKNDLKLLKTYVKSFIPDKYNVIFNENKKGVHNYVAYSKHYQKSSIEDTNCSQADFLDFLKKQLPKTPVSEEYEKMYEEIAVNKFMPKAVSKDNSVIPMQVNKAELIEILKNASSYHPFLLKKDENNKTVIEKILDVFTFRIPYYVGPLNKHSDKAWIERTDEKIYPWNFERVVDVDKSAEKFIEKLTNKCTYLNKEDVLPKNSLLYNKFMVLNELNNLRIDGDKISVELKQKIYNDLFLNNNKITLKRLKDYLKSYISEDVEITGIDGDFTNSLKSVRDFKHFDLSDVEKEEIIKAITVFGDDKKLLRRRLTTQYGDKLSTEDISKICKFKYTGWGRLSHKFLAGITAVDKATGELSTIIDFMWSTNNNLMQLLSNDFDFLEAIKNENGDTNFTNLKKEVEDLYVSPKVKRPIYQTMKIVEEIVKIMGCEPKKIFVEVARGSDEIKKRTVSRKSKLLELYKNCKKTNEELYNALANTEEDKFRRDVLYLYFTQMGRCMYTGKPIDIADIFNKNLYDIDHIFPQSKIKDDSIDNRVLVTKISNEEKGNVYPIKQNIRQSQSAFWSMLLDKGLITQKKYERLVRSYPLSDDELASFIGRQLVETRQSTKAIAHLLDKRYKTEVVYVKANLVSEFRQKYNLIKSRDVNDFHHAKDAYLNIVVGNVYNTRFTHNKAVFIKDVQENRCSVNRMFDYPVEKAWNVEGNNKSIDIVKNTMQKNNIRYTRYSFKQQGGLFDQNILKKGNGQVSIKKNSPLADIDKYGGYNRASSSYFVFIEYIDEKGKTIRSFEPIDAYIESDYKKNPEQYFKEKLHTENVRIIVPCVKYNALISIDDFRMHISSKCGGGSQIVCKPAMQLIVDKNSEYYIKKVSNYMAKCAELRKEKQITEHDEITQDKNIELFNLLIDKCCNTVLNVKFGKLGKSLQENKEVFSLLSLYQQCYVIMQLLQILHCNVVSGDLTLVGSAKKSGIVTISNKVQPGYKSFKLINQSITGLFEQEVDLLK